MNAYTPGNQYAGDLVIHPDGEFVVVWTSGARSLAPAGDTDGSSIQAQRFSPQGSRIGEQFRVNTYTTGNQTSPSVAAGPDGTFVVVWASDVGLSGEEEYWSIFSRRFSKDGAPLQASEIQINEYTPHRQLAPNVAALASGGFVVAWTSRGSFGTDSDRDSIQARRLDASGDPVDPAEFQVNVYTTDSQFFPRPAAAPDGGFVVTWTSWGSFGPDQSMYSVQARRYSAEGQPLDTPEFQVNTLTGDYQWNSDIASSPSGDFVIVWENWIDPVGDDHIGIRARRFAADGTPLDPTDFQVNTYTIGGQGPPKVAANSEGDFVVAWPSVGSLGTDSEGNSAQVRRYRADGTAVDTEELQANVFTVGHQIPRGIAAGPEGDFILTWRSAGSFGDDTDGSSVQARRFGRPRIPVTSTSGGSGGPDCTLVDAVEAASSDQPVGGCPAGSGGGMVQLPPGSTIDLDMTAEGFNALPIVRRSVTLEGRGARVRRDPGLPCDGAGGFRLAEVVDGGVLTLDDVTFQGGCPPAGEEGGAVLASGGTLVLREATIADSRADSGGGVAIDGGGLYAFDSTLQGNLATDRGGGLALLGSADIAWISGSTFSGNSAPRGGGIAHTADAELALTNSTLSGNTATADGGGLLVDHAGARLTADFVTLTDQSAATGAGISVAAGAAHLHGSLVGDDASGTSCAAAGTLTASGANLDTDGSCAALAGGAFSTVASLDLGALGFHGGPTRTHLPRPASPVLDAAPDCATRRGGLLLLDQRGLPRPVDDGGDPGAQCDLGAVEGLPLFADDFESGGTGNWSETEP